MSHRKVHPFKPAARWHGLPMAVCALAGGLALPMAARADRQITPGPAPMVAKASLDFSIRIDKFIFLRVGTGGSFTGADTGTGPAASGTVDTISFTTGTTIPAVPTTATDGSNKPVSWNGALPSFTASSPVSLPVEVRSNSGQVSITGQATTALTSGANTLPMSVISISTSSPQLPAPVMPASGISAPVNVTVGGAGTAAAPTLLTYRTANWTFAYAPSTSAPAGVYNGTITFTASAP